MRETYCNAEVFRLQTQVFKIPLNNLVTVAGSETTFDIYPLILRLKNQPMKKYDSLQKDFINQTHNLRFLQSAGGERKRDIRHLHIMEPEGGYEENIAGLQLRCVACGGCK
jgi:hypothetical protein